METAKDTNWLMQYRLLRLVNQCRRLIQSEFGVKLHLTDTDLRERLAEHAGRTRSQSLQRVYAELRLALIDFEGPDALLVTPPPTPQLKRYRGQVMREDADEEDGLPPLPREEPPPVVTDKRHTRVYRGRVISS
ncbi:hypothetical protein [Isoalcanivorax indicus]|uniref:hypothetical protein n=1 Tax=Isoalcanivorax indicus TaxID=2202653 RepID=UPI000DBA59F9|nr:hypothetical protein [Isoalcanivorax indicus]